MGISILWISRAIFPEPKWSAVVRKKRRKDRFSSIFHKNSLGSAERVFYGVGKYKTFLTTETSQGRVLSPADGGTKFLVIIFEKS